MGLIQSKAKNNIYLQIVKGSLEKTTYQRGEDGRVLKTADGKSVVANKENFPGVEGTLTSIGIRDIDSGGKKFSLLTLNIADGDDNFVVSVNKDSNEAEAIIYALDSVKSFAGKKFSLKVYLHTADNGKTYSNVAIALDDEKVGWSVAPKDRPAFRQVTINNTVQWDRSDRLKDEMTRLAHIQEVLKAEVAQPIAAPAQMAESTAAGAPIAQPPMDEFGNWNDDNVPF